MVGVRNNRDSWAQACMPVDAAEIETEFKIEFYQSQKSGKHTNLGHIEFTLAVLQSGETTFQVTDKKGKVEAKYTCSLGAFQIQKRRTFLDFIFGGCEVGLSVAIDFTGSNGDPKSP